MESTPGPELPVDWEEWWRTEKETRRRVMEEGGEGMRRENRQLRRIVAFNDSRMGLWTEGSEVGAVGPHPERSGGGFGDEGCGDGVHVYQSEASSAEMFQALKELWDSSLLTDLTLITERGGGGGLHVHAPVLAAVSSVIRQRLRGAGGEGFHRGAVSLGPEVHPVGLRAVVEFAYSGVVSPLNDDTVADVEAAARALGVARVLHLCNPEERAGGHGGAEKDEVSALDEMKLTLGSVDQLRADGVGCDVILDVGGTLFHVHRVVLAASSGYFRGMFTCGMRESHQTRIALPFLSPSDFEALVGCSYGGGLSLSWDRVFEISCTALQLQFQPALSLCLDFMRRHMAAESCLDVASFAEAYGMSELLEEANDFVLRNFWEVSSTAKFQDLQAEKLLDFLRCDGLCVPSELAVFRAVTSWIEADPEERLGQAGRLMAAVRFPLMTFREFREVRAVNLRMECFGNQEVELYGSALKEFGSTLPQPEDRWRVRRPKDAVVLVGGDQLDPDVGQRVPSRKLWFSNSLRSGTGLVREIEWRKLGEVPDQPRFRHGVAALDGRLYVIGGCYFYAKDNIMKTAHSYDPGQNRWRRLADMQEFRSNFSVVALGRRLYALGGDREINANVDSVEMYDPDGDSWSFVQPLDRTLSGCAAAVVDGGIFVSGGFDCKYVCLVSMFLYHPRRGASSLADMARDRAQHCMEALRGRLYVSGGVCNLRAFYADQRACEVFDPGTDSWTAFASLPVPHVGAASAVLEEKLYVLGGYCQDDYSECGLVHRFDPRMQRWEGMGRLPGAVTDIRACLLPLPQHFRR